jgi:preprotein translocase subunit SecD
MNGTSYVAACLALIVGIGCQTRHSQVTVTIRAAEQQPGEGLEKTSFSGWGNTETFYLHDEILMTDSAISSASVVSWEGHPAVEAVLTDEGGKRFAEVTAHHIGKHLAIMVDGHVVCAPVVRDTITQGKFLINGDFSGEQARRIADGLTR